MSDDLRFRALLALEGSNRDPDALRSVAEYADDLINRYGPIWLKTNEKMTRELVQLLDHLRESADPSGASPWQMQIVRRGGVTGPKPDPSAKRRRITSAVAAARDVDRMLEANPEMLAKTAHSPVAEARKVPVNEIYEARKDPMYQGVDFSTLDKVLKDNGF